MVDFSDPNFWADGAKVVIAAPQIVFPLLVLGVVAAWWMAKTRYQGTIDGLRERVGALEQRVSLAQDSERAVERKSTQLQAQLAVLSAQITSGEPKENLVGTTTAIGHTVSEIKSANTEMGKMLEPGQLYIFGGDSVSLARKHKL